MRKFNCEKQLAYEHIALLQVGDLNSGLLVLGYYRRALSTPGNTPCPPATTGLQGRVLPEDVALQCACGQASK